MLTQREREVLALVGEGSATRRSPAGRGERLPLDGYGLWLRELERRTVIYTNLLVPGDPEATWQHQRRLETWGLCPIPVVEVAQDHRLLDRYLETGYRHIALSPPPGPRRTRWDLDTALPWLRRGFQMAGPGVGFHLLEATSWALVTALPWYSADVHGWTDAVGGEELVWFDPGQGCFQRVAMGTSDRWQLLGSDGADPPVLSAYERRAVLAGLAAEAWQAAEAWLGDEFGLVTITGSDRAGPRLYLESLGGLQLAHRGFAHLAAALGVLRRGGGRDAS